MILTGSNHRVFKERRQTLRQKSTETEQILWQELRGRKMFGLKFFRQYGIGPYILDFYCPMIKLSIELDGEIHTTEAQAEYDKQRTEYLVFNGIHEIRFWNHEVTNDFKNVFDKIKEAINFKLKNTMSPEPSLGIREGGERM